MSDVYLGSVYARLELKTNDLKTQINHAESILGGLDKTADKTGSTGETAANKMARAFGAVAGVVQSVTSRAFDALASSIDGGIKRFDTMNNFPKVMKNIGISTEESSAVVQDLSEKLKGLPTSLDAATASTQRFTMLTKDVKKAEGWFLALNNAVLAGGASMDLQNSALEQFTQMITAGKPDIVAWRSVIQAMPAQMDMLAKHMGYVSGEAGGDLYEAFLKGKVSAEDLMSAMVELNEKGGDGIVKFSEQAKDATGGIQTQLANIKNAMNRFWQTVFTSIGSDNINKVLQGIYDGIGKLATIVGNFANKVMPILFNALEKMGPAFEKLLDVLGNILSSQAVEVVITAIANALGFLADILSKIPTEVLSAVVMGIVAFKEINKFLPIMKTAGDVLGNLGSKFKLFNGAEKLGGGVGSAVASVLKPLGETSVLKGAASAVVAGAALVVIAIAMGKAMEIDYDIGKMIAFAACVTAAAGIMALIGTFGQYAVIGGIATAVIGGGLLVAAEGLKAASDAANIIDFGALMVFSGQLTIVSGIMAAIGLWGAFSAVGGIASAIIGGGLMVAAKGLAEASKSVREIDMDEIKKFSGMIAEVSIILGAVSGLSIFGAVGSIANAIIGGGLLVTSKALEETGKSVKNIDMDEIKKFAGMVAQISVILGVISGLAIFGAVASVANTIISGGLLLSAIALAEATKHIKKIEESEIDKFNGIISKTSAILSAISLLSAFSTIGAIATTVISGGVLASAMALYEATKYSRKLSKSDMDALGAILAEIASWNTGSVFQNLTNMISTDIMGKTARNVSSVVQTLSGLKPVDDKAIDSLKKNIKNLSELETSGVLKSIGDMWASGNLKEVAGNVAEIIKKLAGLPELPDNGKIDQLKSVIHNLSQIKIEGSGFFENKGAAAQELEGIVGNIVGISKKLSQIPKIEYGSIENFVNCLKLFDRIDNKTKDGIKRLSDLGDSLSNIDWIKHIIGDIPAEIGDNVGNFVNAIKKFNDIDDGTRKSVRELNNLGDSLSNIDWLKRILCDIPSGIYDSVVWFVESIKLFDRIDDNARTGALRLKNMGDSLGNIDWLKHILGDLPDDMYGKVVAFVDSIKVFDRIDENARAGVLRLASLSDGLGNIDWIKHILGDIPEGVDGKAQMLVEAIKKFNGISIDEGALATVAEALGNLLNTVKNSMDGLVSQMKTSGEQSAQNFIQGVQSKFGDTNQQGIAMGNNFKDGLASVNGQLNSVGQAAQGEYWAGIEGKMRDEYYQGEALANQVKNGLKSVNMTEAGQFAVQGFINGANSQNPYSAGWQIANKFLQGLKDRGQQGSPWRTTFQSGVWAGEGFADGIEKSENMVEKAANSIADVAMSAMNLDEFGNIVMSPDMSAISATMSAIPSRIELGGEETGSETNIYGDIYITPNGDEEDVLDELSRANSMVDRGMATRV